MTFPTLETLNLKLISAERNAKSVQQMRLYIIRKFYRPLGFSSYHIRFWISNIFSLGHLFLLYTEFLQ